MLGQPLHDGAVSPADGPHVAQRIFVEVHGARRRKLHAHRQRTRRLIDRGCDYRLPIAGVVLDAYEPSVRIPLKPGGAVLQHVHVSARRKLHLDRRAEIRARHEAFDGHQVTSGVHRHCHDPVTHEFVDEKLAVVVLRKWSGGAAEIVLVKYRASGGGAAAAADDREIRRRRVRIPNEGAECRRQIVEAGVIGRCVDRMRRVELRA